MSESAVHHVTTSPVGPLSRGLSATALAILSWGIIAETYATDHAHAVAGVVMLVVAGLAWIVAMVVRRDASPLALVAVGVMALAGGALVGVAPLAMVFPAVAVLCAALRWRWSALLGTAVGGALATLISQQVFDRSASRLLGCLVAILAGVLTGLARRQSAEYAERAAAAALTQATLDVERERATLLAHRNHLAREVHDVLAHTLAALSLQLEAFATVVESEPQTGPGVREQLERTRRLVHHGLDEARRAVRVLREDSAPLEDQLRQSAARHGASFTTSGDVLALDAEVSLTLYRTAQEALTNVMKHATHAPTTVHLLYDNDVVEVVVQNSVAPGPPLATSGGGYGLQGIAERLALLGGHLDVGPLDGGWRVRARVPLEGGPLPVG